MNKKGTKSLISYFRKSAWSKFCLYLLLANFINLSANFYEGDIYLTQEVRMEDPIDTLTELIFEWALDGNESLIPDNGTEQDDNSLKKIKLAIVGIFGFDLPPSLKSVNNVDSTESDDLISGFFNLDTPPPDFC